MAAIESCINLPDRTNPKSVVANAFSPVIARTFGPMAHTMRAGRADAPEYPKTPNYIMKDGGFIRDHDEYAT